jgi:Ca2+-binding RTX toxin-like protein
MTFDVTRPHPSDRLTLQELDMYHRIMDYRADNGLDPLPLSVNLTGTAGRHAADWLYNVRQAGLDLPDGANLHSWSDAPFIPGDDSTRDNMWFAPQRVGLDYPSEGFEISAEGYADNADALDGWQGSPSHNSVILNQGDWGFDFNAIGVGILSDPGVNGGLPIYHVWFGASVDPDGPPRITGTRRGEDITGTAFADRVDGRGGGDSIAGAAGDDILSGGTGGDVLSGGAGRDRLTGSGGDDTLTGDDGADRFVFSSRNFGRDRITDLDARDKIALTAAGEVDSLTAFIGATTDTGANLVYDLGADGRNVITLVGIDATDLRAGQFDFG